MTSTLRTLLSLGLSLAGLASAGGLAAQIPQPGTATCPRWAASLPAAVEERPYSARVVESNSSDATAPGGLPPGLSLSNDVLQGTPTQPGTFTFNLQISLSYPCANAMPSGSKFVLTKQFFLGVRDIHPPQVTSFAVTPASTPWNGGEVTVAVEASDNLAVAKVLVTQLRPDGHQGSFYLPATGPAIYPKSGKWQQTVPLAVNSSPAAVTYTYTVSVQDLDGNAAKAGPVTVTVGAHGAAPPVVRRP